MRQGDLFALAVARDSVDLVTLHQVLHFLDDPGRALKEAARVLRAGGRLLIVDFAPHGLEFLREEHAHRRLGFSREEMTRMIEAAGLDLVAADDLAASGAGERLTVSVYLARDPRIVVAAGSGATALETIA